MAKKKKLFRAKFAHHKKSFMARLRRYFLTGMLITAPLGLTLFIVYWVINKVDELITPFIPVAYRANTYLPFHIPGFGLLVVLIGLMLIGSITAGFFGRFFVNASETILNRMPVVRGIYGVIKQVFETVLNQNSNAFRQVILLEYPRRGVWAIGFVTGETKGEVKGRFTEEMINIFLPTTPNPTSGFFLFVSKKDIIYLDMTVDEGIKMVMSSGLVTPDAEQMQKMKKHIYSKETSEKEGSDKAEKNESE